MNPRVLPAGAWTVVRRLAALKLTSDWWLAGGTGLALQLGHRVSIDLDFFNEDHFDSEILRVRLAAAGPLEVHASAGSTLHVSMEGVRLSYLHSEVPFLFPPLDYRGLRIADVRDIAAMKLVAIGGRGSRKDFVDLHAYLKAGGELRAVMELVRRRYEGTRFNEIHLMKSLVYFDDAEQEPMPRMLTRSRWEDIRAFFEAEVRRLAP